MYLYISWTSFQLDYVIILLLLVLMHMDHFVTGFLIRFCDSLLFPCVKCFEITKKLSWNELFQILFHILCGKQIIKERRKNLFSGKLVRTQLYVDFVATLSGVAKKAYHSSFNMLTNQSTKSLLQIQQMARKYC